jgi:hypothetical protein
MQQYNHRRLSSILRTTHSYLLPPRYLILLFTLASSVLLPVSDPPLKIMQEAIAASDLANITL